MEQITNMANLYQFTIEDTKNLYLGDMPLTSYHKEALNNLPYYQKLKFMKSISYQDLVLLDYLAHQSYEIQRLENEVVDKTKELDCWQYIREAEAELYDSIPKEEAITELNKQFKEQGLED